VQSDNQMPTVQCKRTYTAPAIYFGSKWFSTLRLSVQDGKADNF
jgi:hypothetical protein